MPTGVELQLFNGASPAANMLGIQALWWDVTEPGSASRPVGRSSAVETDASGWIRLDLSKVTGLAPSDHGFLVLYKLDATNHEDSQIFAGKVAVSTIASGVDMYYYDSGWTRPVDWLPLPNVGPTEQKFVGLHAVYPENANFVALSASGAYTVDWGDGTVENFAAGVVAQRNINYTAPALDGTECSRGYKQTVITVTPQAGQTLTAFSLDHRYSLVGNLSQYCSGWIDCVFSGPDSTFTLNQTGAVRFSWLEQIKILSASIGTAFAGMMSDCESLRSVPVLDTAGNTDFAEMFRNCYALKTIPLLDTSSGVTFEGMFRNCSSLESIPLLDTSSGVNFQAMFNGCRSLRSVPLFDTSAGTDFGFMFSYMGSLQAVPLLDTSLGESFSDMFSYNEALQTVPHINTSSGLALNGMFAFCPSLQSVPLLDVSSCIDFGYDYGWMGAGIFDSCPSLEVGALSGTKVSISYAQCKLPPAELNRIYENLGAPLGGAKTIDVSFNWGASADNPALVPAGWTVVGS